MMKATLLAAVQAGAAQLQQYFNQPNLKVSLKDGGPNDLVTEADHAADRAIIAAIRAEYPHHVILSEETGNQPSESPIKWIIDPIDGTINFANGIPICCVSVGVEQHGQMILGAVYNPFMNELFVAEKGMGAFLNDRRLAVSRQSQVLSSFLVTGFPYSYMDAPNGPLQCFERFIRRGIPVRRLGSAAIDLCWVAAGRFDAFYEHKLQAWDSAAGFLMVQEAGGTVTDLHNQPYSPYQPGIIASNGHLHAELHQWLQGNVPA
jgi:myo-inositol-1(or 4)-monophosphatase